MNVGVLVEDWLREHGYEGLCDLAHECSCVCDCLMDCGYQGYVIRQCEPGYKVPCDCADGECRYHISPEKPEVLAK